MATTDAPTHEADSRLNATKPLPLKDLPARRHGADVKGGSPLLMLKCSSGEHFKGVGLTN